MDKIDPDYKTDHFFVIPVDVAGTVDSVDASEGSQYGGTVLTITGSGFSDIDSASVSLGTLEHI